MPKPYFFQVDIMRLCGKNKLSFCFSVVDTNDRFLRKITVGQASTEKGQIREVCNIHASFSKLMVFF